MGTTGTVIGRGLRVGELAEAAGVRPDTVRYYERAGLLPPPKRTPAGYRAYDQTAVERLRFIQGCQRLGLRLRDIADLLAIRDTGRCPCEPAETAAPPIGRPGRGDGPARGTAGPDGRDGRRAACRGLSATEPGHHLVPATGEEVTTC